MTKPKYDALVYSYVVRYVDSAVWNERIDLYL